MMNKLEDEDSAACAAASFVMPLAIKSANFDFLETFEESSWKTKVLSLRPLLIASTLPEKPESSAFVAGFSVVTTVTAPERLNLTEPVFPFEPPFPEVGSAAHSPSELRLAMLASFGAQSALSPTPSPSESFCSFGSLGKSSWLSGVPSLSESGCVVPVPPPFPPLPPFPPESPPPPPQAVSVKALETASS